MKVLGGLALLCFVLFDLDGTATTEINCAKIMFKHSQENNMEVEERSTASIVFEVRNDSCSHLQDEQLHVLRDTNEYCRIRNLTEWVSAVCLCKKYLCSVNQNFSRRDSGPWTFRSRGDRIKEETLNVNVTYPPIVMSFTLSYKIEVISVETQSIQATCKWENGNPRKRILLRNPRNQVIAEKWPTNVNDTTLSKYIFVSNTSCSDSGLYRCEAENTDEYKSASLQIKCPPQFLESDGTADTVIPGEDVTRHYNLFSYTNITRFTLKGPGDVHIQNCVSNKREVNVTGKPPHLNLTLVIRDVREEDNGTWQLSVENGFQGKASIPNVATVKFTLDVIPLPAEPPPTSPLVSALIGVVGFLVIVIVVLVIFVVYLRSQRKGAVIRTRNADSQGDGPPDRVSGHLYEEVPDAAAPRPLGRHHHGQGQTSRPGGSPAAPTRPAVDSQPDDYLYPVNSQTASRGTNQSADVPAAEPGGPYNSLEMSDVGLRSPYSQLGM